MWDALSCGFHKSIMANNKQKKINCIYVHHNIAALTNIKHSFPLYNSIFVMEIKVLFMVIEVNLLGTEQMKNLSSYLTSLNDINLTANRKWVLSLPISIPFISVELFFTLFLMLILFSANVIIFYLSEVRGSIDAYSSY